MSRDFVPLNALHLIRAAVEPNAHTLRENFISLLRQANGHTTLRGYKLNIHGDKVDGQPRLEIYVIAPNETVSSYAAEYSRKDNEVRLFGGSHKVVIRSANSPRDLLNQLALHAVADAERNDE